MIDSKIQEEIARELQAYCQGEFEFDLGRFEAEELLKFVLTKAGPALYNQGLQDAHAYMRQAQENMSMDILALEK